MNPLTPEQAGQAADALLAQAQADRDAKADAAAPPLPWLLRTPGLLALPPRQWQAAMDQARRSPRFRLEQAVLLVAATGLVWWWLARQNGDLWVALLALPVLVLVRRLLERRAINRLLRP